jgi:hypothetical protein
MSYKDPERLGPKTPEGMSNSDTCQENVNNANKQIGVLVQPCFGVEVSFKVPQQIAVGTAKCPADLPVTGTPLTIVGNTEYWILQFDSNQKL